MSFYYIDKYDASKLYLKHHKRPVAAFNVSAFSFDGKTTENDSLSVFRHHHHDVFELIYIKDGEFLITLEDNVYHLKKGDVMVMNPFEVHYGEWLPNGMNNEYLCLIVSSQMLFSFKNSELFKIQECFSRAERVFNNYVPANSDAGRMIGRIILELNDLPEENDAVNNCKNMALIYSLFAILFEKCYKEPDDDKESPRNIDFIKNVTLYLNDNYTEPISTADISKALFMTSSRFCHMFRQNFGMSFSNHLCKFRVIRASEIYKNTRTPLTEVAASVGFLDYNYFSKMFKKYIGESPARHFKRWNK